MKNAPHCGVRLSESRIGQRQEETSIHEAFIKPDYQQEERSERSLPHHSPQGFHTEAELRDFITTHEWEGEV